MQHAQNMQEFANAKHKSTAAIAALQKNQDIMQAKSALNQLKTMPIALRIQVLPQVLANYEAATGERLDSYEPLDPSHPLEFSTAFIEAVSAIPGLPVPEQPNPYGPPGTSASLSGQPTVNPTMTGQPVDPRSMGLGDGQTAPKVPGHTGHSKDDIPTGLGPNDRVPESLGLRDLVSSDTAHRDNEKPAVTNVFEWSTDYRKNYEKAYGAIPAGSQIHHLAPQASFKDSDLAQEWTQRVLLRVHDPRNLVALPQTKDAYDKSSIKIQHSGSHSKWNAHVEDTLEREKDRLKLRYGSLDKVPDNVLEQSEEKIMKKLREDLLDKNLGIKGGWIQPQPSGMDKLSQAEFENRA